MAKDFPKIQIVGNFFLAKQSRSIIGSVIDPREEVLVVAPTKNATAFGTTNRGFSGCAYAVQDGKVEFKKLLAPSHLPQRVKLMPGEV